MPRFSQPRGTQSKEAFCDTRRQRRLVLVARLGASEIPCGCPGGRRKEFVFPHVETSCSYYTGDLDARGRCSAEHSPWKDAAMCHNTQRGNSQEPHPRIGRFQHGDMQVAARPGHSEAQCQSACRRHPPK